MKFKIVHGVSTALAAFVFVASKLPTSPLVSSLMQVASALLGLFAVFSSSVIPPTLAPASAVTVTQVTGPEVKS